MRSFRKAVLAGNARALADVIALAGLVAYMIHAGAPGWAIALAVYVATRASRLDSASDKAAVQSSVRYVDANVDRVYDALSRAVHEARQAREQERGGGSNPPKR